MCEEGIAGDWKYKDGPVSAQDEQRLGLREGVDLRSGKLNILVD